MYPAPESNRHGFPLVFETNASTNSASWAFPRKRERKSIKSTEITQVLFEVLTIISHYLSFLTDTQRINF